MPERQVSESITRITRTDKNYQEHLQDFTGFTKPEEYAFGHKPIENAEHMRNGPEIIRENCELGYKRGLIEIREDLKSLVEDQDSMSGFYLHDFLSRSGLFKDDLLMKVLFGNTKASDLLSKKIEKLPDNTLEKLIANHVKEFNDKLVIFNKVIPKWKVRFNEKILEKINNGEYNLPKKILRQQMKQVKVVLGDALRIDLTSDQGGRHDNFLNTVMVAEQEFTQRGEEIYTHEMFHALSGQTIIKWGDDEEMYEYDYQRSGLKIIGVKGERFKWLNEAVTQSLAKELLPKTVDSIYKKERDLYDLLRIKGKEPIDNKLFLNAYFENYDPTLPYGERIPEWKKLFATLDYAYYPGFLVKLDKFVKMNGVEKAIEVMSKDWTEIIIPKAQDAS